MDKDLLEEKINECFDKMNFGLQSQTQHYRTYNKAYHLVDAVRAVNDEYITARYAILIERLLEKMEV